MSDGGLKHFDAPVAHARIRAWLNSAAYSCRHRDEAHGADTFAGMLPEMVKRAIRSDLPVAVVDTWRPEAA